MNRKVGSIMSFRVFNLGLARPQGVLATPNQRIRTLVSLALIVALSLVSGAFAQETPSGLYDTISSQALADSAALRSNGVAIMGGVVVALFAISYVRKILAAR